MTSNSSNIWLNVLFAYLIMDYARPHETIPIGFIKPVFLIILMLAYYVIKTNALSKSMCSQTKMIWVVVILLCVHVPFARNNYLAFATARNMLLFMPFILSATVLINSFDNVRKSVIILIALMSYIALFSLFHRGFGTGNYFEDENDLSLYIVTWLGLCYFLLKVERSLKVRILCCGGLLIGLLAIVNSFSRGGFVGLVCSMAVAWLFSPKKVLSAFLIMILAATVFIAGGDRYMNRLSTIQDQTDSTATERILSWKAAWNMFLEHPLGVGGNNFQIWFPFYQPPEMKRGMYGRVAHSLWFTLIPELGVPGIIFFCLLIFYNIRDISFMGRFKHHENEQLRYIYMLSRAYLVCTVGYFASGTFVSVLYYPHYWYLTALIVATRRVTDGLLARDTIEGKERLPLPGRTRFGLLPHPGEGRWILR